MDDYNEIILNRSHVPNSHLREDIVNEVNEYIGYVYADDTHLGDCLTINKNTLEVSHGHFRNEVVRDSNLAYYSMDDLITHGAGAFTFVPYEPGIDIVLLDFFPIEKLSNFIKTSEKSITDFLQRNGSMNSEAVIGFGLDDFVVDVFNPNDIPEADEATIEELDSLDNCVEYIEVPLKHYSAYVRGKVRIYKRKLLLLALSHYYE